MENLNYNHLEIESKWQKKWEFCLAKNSHLYHFKESKTKPKMYVLDMFPYPSGSGLHVGHPKGYTATDVYARFKKLQGFNVMHPIGWDAFGLPAEQYALQTKNDPAIFTEQNIDNFRTQLKKLGFFFHPNKEVNTTDPKYYKWTQWIFLQLLKKGLAEIKEIEVNWCPNLGTVLANEEILLKNNVMVSERGEHPVYKKPMRQWVLKITKYAERLLSDLDNLDWPESVKELQRKWIGKSEGAVINFKACERKITIPVFTTRPDTIFGVSALVLSPGHPDVLNLTVEIEKETVLNYIKKTQQKMDLERQEINKDFTGVFLGSYALHPITKQKLPIWIADYILENYGKGAIMLVPAHDERDYSFAKKYNLKITKIIKNDVEDAAFTEDGDHINSKFINGLNIVDGSKKVIKYLVENKIGKKEINYKLRDWVFSRQRYWGEPFPVYFDKDNNVIPMNESDLPLILPKSKDIQLSKDGTGPLGSISDWINFEKHDIHYKRDSNTMPQWAGSSWYYLAYLLKQDDGNYLPLNSSEAKKILNKWLPVDLYIGGQEHAVLHLLYARFWHKVLFDLKIFDKNEPFQRLFNQGMILGPNGEKMSKSRGNVISPDEIINNLGADSLRLYEMFMGPLDSTLAWQNESLESMHKWLTRVFNLFTKQNYVQNSKNFLLEKPLHKLIKFVQTNIDHLKYNVCISEMMVFINSCYKEEYIGKSQAEAFLTILSCFCPHIADELNEIIGNNNFIFLNHWPYYDEKILEETEVNISCQINGKFRGMIVAPKDSSEKEIVKLCNDHENIQKYLLQKDIIKIIFIKDRAISIIVK